MFIIHLTSFRWLAGAGLMLAAVLHSSAVPAATVNNLYDAVVAVVGQDAVERRRGFELALESVLVKLTGDGAVATRPELAPLMAEAQVYVAQYRYRSFESPPDNPDNPDDNPDNNKGQFDDSTSNGSTSTTGIGVEPTHHLEVSFAPRSLNHALNAIGLPLWGDERPETLLWLVVQETSRRYILAGSSATPVRESLDQITQKRALPVLLPLMDLQDQNAVDFFDIRSGFTDRVQNASRRYGVDTVLTGSLQQHASGWTARWVLYHDERTFNWSAKGREIGDVITVGMEGLANQLASKFSIAVNYSQASYLYMHVDNVDSIDDYARVLAYLSDLSVVEKVSVARLTPTASYFRLDTVGSVVDLQNAIALNSVLSPAEIDATATIESGTLSYRFRSINNP